MPANDRVACTQFHFGHDKKLKAKVTVAVPRQKIFRAYDVVMEPSPTSFDRTEAQLDSSAADDGNGNTNLELVAGQVLARGLLS
jgi:hypothetical protein